MRKVFISTSSFGKYDPSPIKLLEDKGFKVVSNPFGRQLKKNEVIELCGDAVCIIAGTEILDSDVMEKLINLKVISRCGGGLDNVDCGAARKRGIKIFNTPDAPTLAVSELTVGLILNLLRKITKMHNDIKNGKWDKMMGNLLYGKKVGIIGLGRIGKKTADILKAFGSEIAYADPNVNNAPFKRLALESLLGWADIVTLHVSGKDRILGESELKLMESGSLLINTSRGGVVDENALYHALKSGHLGGAALDVFEEEPYRGPLSELDNVILTPHIGSYAKEARVEMEREAVLNMLKGLGV